MTPCSSIEFTRRFAGRYWFHHHGWRVRDERNYQEISGNFFLVLFFHHEDGSNMVLRNFGEFLPAYMTLRYRSFRTWNPVFEFSYQEICNFVFPDGRKVERQLRSLLSGLPVNLTLNRTLTSRQFWIKNNIKMDLKIVGLRVWAEFSCLRTWSSGRLLWDISNYQLLNDSASWSWFNIEWLIIPIPKVLRTILGVDTHPKWGLSFCGFCRYDQSHSILLTWF